MRTTINPAKAAQRLADHLGYEMRSEGRVWRLTHPRHTHRALRQAGLEVSRVMKAVEALGSMIEIATMSENMGGNGMSYRDCWDACRLNVPAKKFQGGPWWEQQVRMMLLAAP